MQDPFPAPSYATGDKGKESGCIQFDDACINTVDESSGFSEDLANESFTFEMDLSEKVTLFVFKITCDGGIKGPVNLKMKVDDAFTMLTQDITFPATLDKAWDVPNRSLIQFYFTSGSSKARLDIRPSALAFLQLFKTTQKYLDVSIDSRSAFGDIKLRLGCLPK